MLSVKKTKLKLDSSGTREKVTKVITYILGTMNVQNCITHNGSPQMTLIT